MEILGGGGGGSIECRAIQYNGINEQLGKFLGDLEDFVDGLVGPILVYCI